MPSSTFGEYIANHTQDATAETEPHTGWTRDGAAIAYVFEDREVEYEEYLDLLSKDRTRDPKDIHIMMGETPAPGDPA